jgi:hypothetical protein
LPCHVGCCTILLKPYSSHPLSYSLHFHSHMFVAWCSSAQSPFKWPGCFPWRNKAWLHQTVTFFTVEKFLIAFDMIIITQITEILGSQLIWWNHPKISRTVCRNSHQKLCPVYSVWRLYECFEMHA